MDRCKLLSEYYSYSTINYAISINPDTQPTTQEITSEPYSLCLCTVDCHTYFSRSMEVVVYRGQEFTVPLLARMQYGTTATIVTAITSSTARLETYQTSQTLPDYCAPLSYTVYSNKSHEQVVLYPDGPCRDTGVARVVIDVTLLPCPDGFNQSGEICTCEDRLHDYPVNCTIADIPYLTKKGDLNFWMGVVDVTPLIKVWSCASLVQQNTARKELSMSPLTTQTCSVTSIVQDCCVELVLLTTASCLADPNVKSVLTPT